MKILIAGDYCPNYRIADMLSKQDYSFFDNVKPLIQQADYSIVNFECPVVNGDVKPIVKCGPALRTSAYAVDSIKYVGFDCVTLANNHFRDFGDEGCKTTIEELNKKAIDYVGGGLNLSGAQQILYKEIKGHKVAFVNFCENEFSIATNESAGAAPLDAVDNYNQIVEARRNADYVIVIVHGGHEYYQLPSPRMKKLYRHFVTIGADAVVNHHQHCYSGYEYYNGKPIVYGLGNFCFDWKDKPIIWNEGYMACFSVENEKMSLVLIPYNQCGELPAIVLMEDDVKRKFYSDIDSKNDIISNDVLLNNHFEEWCSSRSPFIQTIFNSYHNRYLDAAMHRGWIGRPIPWGKMTSILNYMMCEAHRDISLNVLNKQLNK